MEENPALSTELERSASFKRPEVELLLRCARICTSSETTDRIVALIQEGVDWEYLLHAAYRHGLASLFYWHLNGTCPQAVPKYVLDQLRNHFHANRLRNLYLTGELLKIVGKLEAGGIPAVPYKGPVLAACAYGNLALREFGDLDILVHKRDVPRASEVLISLGFEPQYSMTKAQETAFLRYERQYLFTRNDGSVVELHWTVTPRSISFLLDPEHLWGRTGRTLLGGGTVSTLSSEDLILTLCVHGSAHRWESLGWICDVAELVHASGDVAWEQLVERASMSNCKRMLLLGLLLANELFGADLPEKVLREAWVDAGVRTLVVEVLEKLFPADPGSQEIDEEGFSRWRFHLRMIERLRDKLRYCVHQATAPTLLDWELMPLPAAFFPCYRLLRPIRLSSRFVWRLLDYFYDQGSGWPRPKFPFHDVRRQSGFVTSKARNHQK